MSKLPNLPRHTYKHLGPVLAPDAARAEVLGELDKQHASNCRWVEKAMHIAEWLLREYDGSVLDQPRGDSEYRPYGAGIAVSLLSYEVKSPHGTEVADLDVSFDAEKREVTVIGKFPDKTGSTCPCLNITLQTHNLDFAKVVIRGAIDALLEVRERALTHEWSHDA